jgi:uncharacterized membrane protein
MWAKLSGYFLRGFFALLPLFITIWLLIFMFNFLDGILGAIFDMVLGRHIPGLGFAVSVLLIFLTGFIITHILGQRLFTFGERILYRVPIIKTVYSSVKQVNDVLFQKKEHDDYRKACVVEYPRQGIYSIGFVTSEAAKEIEMKSGKGKMVNIFIANTPTPATGFLIIMPSEHVKLLDMKIEEAFKYVVSGGVLKPKA